LTWAFIEERPKQAEKSGESDKHKMIDITDEGGIASEKFQEQVNQHKKKNPIKDPATQRS
jgi:hypothetical protein